MLPSGVINDDDNNVILILSRVL